MLDFMFAVTHPGHWHSINMAQYPGHYAMHARMLGSDFVSRVQEWPPGVWFNTFVKVNDVVRTLFLLFSLFILSFRLIYLTLFYFTYSVDSQSNTA